jgi:endonuclease-3 related protein
MFAQPLMKLREELLALNGVGPETADSILLYAGNQPVFVVDDYTRRILERHALIGSRATYDEIRELVERALAPIGADASGHASKLGPANLSAGPRGTSHSPSRMSQASRTPLAQVFNEMHGLLVGVGKNYCLKSQMRCEECPLQKFLPDKS